jgi:hypothetical protein
MIKQSQHIIMMLKPCGYRMVAKKNHNYFSQAVSAVKHSLNLPEVHGAKLGISCLRLTFPSYIAIPSVYPSPPADAIGVLSHSQ